MLKSAEVNAAVIATLAFINASVLLSAWSFAAHEKSAEDDFQRKRILVAPPGGRQPTKLCRWTAKSEPDSADAPLV
jgi:hypothetical protein